MVDIVVLGVNDVGKRVLEWLRERDDATVCAVLSGNDDIDVVHDEKPDLLLSAGFRHIVPEDVLSVPSRGAVNLHKSYLPYNRGANPNVWTIVDDTPAGVSIHYMTSDIDAGPIIDRREVSRYPDDNARDLYERLERAQFDQFVDVWPEIRDGDADTLNPDIDSGTYHRKREFVDLWELDRSEETTVGNLLDRLRALTFPPHKNAYFEREGEKYYVEIEITPESEITDDRDTDSEIPTYTEDEIP